MKKTLSKVFFFALGIIVGTGGITLIRNKYMKSQNAEREKQMDRFHGYFKILDAWLILREESKSLNAYFYKNNYKTVGIYGLGIMGNHLLEELKGDEAITVQYAIDKKAGKIYANIDVLSPEDQLPPVDVIVVTATFDYAEIKLNLSEKVDCPIVSLEDIVLEI